MTWREKTVLRILLCIAGFISDESWRKEIRDLANHINLHTPSLDKPEKN